MHERLKKNPRLCTNEHTQIVKQMTKNQIKFLPCSDVADLNNYKIVETDASEIGYGGIIKQKKNNTE